MTGTVAISIFAAKIDIATGAVVPGAAIGGSNFT